MPAPVGAPLDGGRGRQRRRSIDLVAGALEIYVGAENQHELRRYRWCNGTYEKEVVAPLRSGDIAWSIASGMF